MRFLNNNYICALDISSSKIAAACALMHKGAIREIFFDCVPSKGIERGSILDSIELVSCVELVLKRLKAKSGINIKYIYTDFSGQDITAKHSRAIIPLAERGNKVITLSDIENVNDQARILGSNLEEEIIDQVPFSYAIDSQSEITNPLGLYSHRLEVDLYLICAKLSSIQTLTRVINQSGCEIRDLFFSATSTSFAVFNDSLRKGVNVLCDIGSDTTEVLIFKDGMLKAIEIMLLGSNELTAELSNSFKIPFDLAEDLKRSYASIQDSSALHAENEILIKKDNTYKPIKQSLVILSVTGSAKKISQAIKEKIEANCALSEVNNFFACGQSVFLEGFLEILENTFGVPVKLGRAANPDLTYAVGNSRDCEGRKYLTYLTCLGIISRVIHQGQARFSTAAGGNRRAASRIIDKFKEVYQEYF